MDGPAHTLLSALSSSLGSRWLEPVHIARSVHMRTDDKGEPGSVSLTDISALGFWVRPCKR